MKRRDFLKYLGFLVMGSTIPFVPIEPNVMHFIEHRKYHLAEIAKFYNVPECILDRKFYRAKIGMVKNG